MKKIQLGIIVTALILLGLSSFISTSKAQNHGGNHQSWPDSLNTITLTGVVIIDSTHLHPQYYLDVDGDGLANYQLMFGPWWYQPETDATLPNDGETVTIVGNKASMVGQHVPEQIIVFEINGQKWRDPVMVGRHGWNEHNSWVAGEDSLTITGMVLIDTTYFYSAFFIDIDGDSIPEYKLGFGPPWYDPANGVARPNNGDFVTIFGYRHTTMFNIDMLIVYRINGLQWRSGTGPAPWAGAWMQRNHSDTMQVYCVNDSSNWMVFSPGHMGQGGMGMGGMRWPDSVFVQFWEIHPDSLPGDFSSGHIRGFYVNAQDPMGNSMMGGSAWGGSNWGGHHGRMEFEKDHQMVFHYRDDYMMKNNLDEGMMEVHYWDPTMEQWLKEENVLIDLNTNTVTINSNSLNTFYALFAQPTVTSVLSDNPTPDQFELLQNYPNPFNPETTIIFHVKQRSNVLLEIYNIAGQRLTTVVNEKREPGSYRVVWDGKDNSGNQLASGIYLMRLQLEGQRINRNITLLR